MPEETKIAEQPTKKKDEMEMSFCSERFCLGILAIHSNRQQQKGVIWGGSVKVFNFSQFFKKAWNLHWENSIQAFPNPKNTYYYTKWKGYQKSQPIHNQQWLGLDPIRGFR